MKIKSLLAVLVIITLCIDPIYSLHAQEVKIDGTTYITVKKESLNTDAEFVKLKGAGKTKEESYIKVNTAYHKTSFTSSGLKDFLATGKLSSLGAVKKSKMAGKPITYIDNGSSIVIVNYNKTSIGFIDIQDGQTILSTRNSFAKAYDDNQPGGSTGDPFLDCAVICLDDYIACGNSESCKSSYRTCYLGCKSKYPSRTGGANSSYIIPLNKLAVKIL